MNGILLVSDCKLFTLYHMFQFYRYRALWLQQSVPLLPWTSLLAIAWFFPPYFLSQVCCFLLGRFLYSSETYFDSLHIIVANFYHCQLCWWKLDGHHALWLKQSVPRITWPSLLTIACFIYPYLLSRVRCFILERFGYSSGTHFALLQIIIANFYNHQLCCWQLYNSLLLLRNQPRLLLLRT